MQPTAEDLKSIKENVINQISSTFAEDKKQPAIDQINSMNDEEFITFLKQQGIIKEDGETAPGPQEGTQCIFCSIVFGDVPSTRLGENEKAISILELNPTSRGHALVIPKSHVRNEEDMPTDAKKLAEEIKIKLQKSLNPKRVDLIPGNVMDHQIINILPIFNAETINSPRQQQTPEGLAKLKEEIELSTPEPPKLIEEPKKEDTDEINEKNTWLPDRKP